MNSCATVPLLEWWKFAVADGGNESTLRRTHGLKWRCNASSKVYKEKVALTGWRMIGIVNLKKSFATAVANASKYFIFTGTNTL